MKWLAFSICNSKRDNFFSLTVPMKSNSTLFYIIIIVSFCSQSICIFKVCSKISSQLKQQRNIFPWDDPSFSSLIIWILRLITKAKIMACMFIHDSAIHKSLGVPIKMYKFLKQLLSILLYILQKTINSSFNNKYTSIICLYLNILI